MKSVMVEWSGYLVIHNIHICAKSVMVKWVGYLIIIQMDQYSELNLYLIFRRCDSTSNLVSLKIKIYKLILVVIIQE